MRIFSPSFILLLFQGLAKASSFEEKLEMVNENFIKLAIKGKFINSPCNEDEDWLKDLFLNKILLENFFDEQERLEGYLQRQMPLGKILEQLNRKDYHSWPEKWLEDLSSLSKNSLLIILNELNYGELIYTHPNYSSSLLKHIKSRLYPENFFSGDSRIKFSKEIQQALYSLLSLDEICNVLVKHPMSTTQSAIVVTNEPNVVIELCDLVVIKFNDEMLRIISQDLELQNIITRLASYEFTNYTELCEKIYKHKSEEEKFKLILTKHSFFNMDRLSKILNSKRMEYRLKKIITKEMKPLSIPYRLFVDRLFDPRLVNRHLDYLLEFLKNSNPKNLLLEEPKSGKNFLDQFMLWLIKEKA